MRNDIPDGIFLAYNSSDKSKWDEILTSNRLVPFRFAWVKTGKKNSVHFKFSQKWLCFYRLNSSRLVATLGKFCESKSSSAWVDNKWIVRYDRSDRRVARKNNEVPNMFCFHLATKWLKSTQSLPEEMNINNLKQIHFSVWKFRLRWELWTNKQSQVGLLQNIHLFINSGRRRRTFTKFTKSGDTAWGI